MNEPKKWKQEVKQLIQGCKEHFHLEQGSLLVIGCSTSEIIGEKIGTSGTMEVAKVLFEALHKYANEQQLFLAFQCCEHLNRALVLEKEIAKRKGWEQVSVIPAPHAGGSMATYAFQHLEEAVLVETIQADAGIDIGDTFIGMHLKPVAVPIRMEQKQIGYAHVTSAITRPKLIGGARAIYE
ncbi:UPF0340 protein YwlG [Bacillus sp. J14TS2]|uniref:TIGR01440 family protein n=1 Tax=Bacillus sp. J14TS2 TaxID=2807188 RepID=UPI001B17F12C|nr:TIGR01440 family protein [Bacillus sp. J14TS2]GIN69751.1 UPF0340 protein YwlG [Bacillus sp. J14TS2]